MGIQFVIPTLYGFREPNYLPTVLDMLAKQCKIANVDRKIIVLGRHNELFDKLERQFIEKVYLKDEKPAHVNVWVNEFVKTIKDDDYCCFFHDDLLIDYDLWIKMFLNIYNTKSLNCGVLGVLSHSNSIVRYVGENLYQSLYPNGAIFLSGKLAKIGFNPEFDYECNDLDLCYEVIYRGYKNYLVAVPHRHYMVPYKETYKTTEDMLAKINDCRIRFNKKWNEKIPNNDWSNYL